jgi:hypothetical protein
VQIGAGPGDAYLDGAAYSDHEPLNAQMAFRLVHDPRWILLDTGWAGISALGLLVVTGLLYAVPGWALLAWLWPGNQLSWAERLGIAVGLSLALYPLLLLWTDLAGLHLGPLYAWLPVVGSLAILIWRHRRWRPWNGWEAIQRWMRSPGFWPDLALLVTMGLVFGVRLLPVRSLDAPMWGDSYQHTMIAQLIVDNGGLFDSWEPYAPLQTYTYHFGFHAAVAVIHWLTRLGTIQACIWVGQILNGLAALVLYPLAVRTSGSRWAGVGAVLVAGLFSSMPMYYLNWGRYTQLAGQVVLPTAVLLTSLTLEVPRRKLQIAILSWIAVGGLALTHYRVLIFYAVYVIAWVLLSLSRATWRRILSRVTWVGLGAIVLSLPWFVHIFSGEMVGTFGLQLGANPSQLSTFLRQYNAIGDLSHYLSLPLWLILFVAVAAGLWQRRRGVLLMSLWWFLLFVLTNPAWLYLPGSGAVSNFALFIAAYIPAGVMVGDLFGQLVARFRFRGWFSALMVLVVTATGLGGARLRMEDVQPRQHAMVTRPDLRAAEWLQENTSRDARFLVNSFFAYGGHLIVGSDGGWWLPLLARRANTVPPLNYDIEQGAWPGYREWVKAPTQQLSEAGIDDAGTLTLLRDRGITHVYIGQRQGRVNYAGPHVLDPDILLRSVHYRPAYHQDRVWVFEVIQGD